ncbi:MAG: hypothetical protein HKN87_06130 [Saprospiraceae bacterium]|nr:hypothetical protein [Saprospiraceae bacterium]
MVGSAKKGGIQDSKTLVQVGITDRQENYVTYVPIVVQKKIVSSQSGSDFVPHPSLDDTPKQLRPYYH